MSIMLKMVKQEDLQEFEAILKEMKNFFNLSPNCLNFSLSLDSILIRRLSSKRGLTVKCEYYKGAFY